MRKTEPNMANGLLLPSTVCITGGLFVSRMIQ